MAAFAAPASQRTRTQTDGADASDDAPTGRQPKGNKRKKKKKKKTKQQRQAAAAADPNEPPAYTKWMVNKCLRCGDPHLVAVCPVAKEEDDRTDADKEKVKAFKAEAKAVRAKRAKWVKEQE